MDNLNVGPTADPADVDLGGRGGVSGYWIKTRKGRRCFGRKRGTRSGYGFVKKASCYGARKTTRRRGKGRRRAAGRRRDAFRSVAHRAGKPRWIKVGRMGRRCAVPVSRTAGGRRGKGFTFVKSARCGGGLRGLRGGFRGIDELSGAFSTVEPSPYVAILGDASPADSMDMDLDERRRRRRKGGLRGLSGHRRARKGACLKWSKGRKRCLKRSKARTGGRRRSLRGLGRLGRLARFRGLEAPDLEFMADGTPLAGEVPKRCMKWETVKSPAFGRDIKVCTAFEGVDEPEDMQLAGPLAKWMGFGQVGDGLNGPLTGVAIAAVAAGILGRFGGALPFADKIPGGGLGLAALIAGGVAYFVPRYRQIAVGALTGIASVLAYSVLAPGGPSNVSGYFGSIVAEDMGSIVAEDMGGLGADVDVLSDYDDDDEDDMEGLGDGVDVLSGAFGSLPFAGAV